MEWLTPAEMGDDPLLKYIRTTKRKITQKGLEKCSSDLLPINSIILSTRAPIGYISINKKEMAINQGCKAIIPKDNYYYEFLYYTILYNRQKLINLGAGNTFKELSKHALESFKIYFPLNKQEQQKIADTLRSLDKMIEAQKQKVEGLKRYKKALMQRLFPKEGEKVPSLRFPEFKDSGEWVEKRIIDLLDYERPDKYIVKNENYLINPNEGIPVLTANKSFILGYTDENFGIYTNLPAIIFDDFTIESKYVNFPFKIKSSVIKILKAKNKNNLKFIYELINNINFIVAEHKRYYISEFQYKKVLVPHPKEQQKIANTLLSLDKLIEAESKKIEVLQKHKKGLMQQLFVNEEK
nr:MULTISPECIES: restriction endonuclease subunit S [unclassified Nitratiruptor]